MGQFTRRNLSGTESETMGEREVSPQDAGVDDQLVKTIADRVFRQLMLELKYDRERLHLFTRQKSFRKGGF